jgi:hypothetical protein
MKQLIYRAVVVAAIVAVAVTLGGCEQDAPDRQRTLPDSPILPAQRTPPGNAIEIATADDLAKIGTTGYPLNRAYKLTADIAVEDWTPLANGEGKPFQGAFYGESHTVTISSGTGGLFAQMKEATVYDLTVNVTAAAEGGNMGGIAGYVERSRIEGCTAVVNLTLNGTGHNASAGGIAGFMRNWTTVINCTASGYVILAGDTADGLMVYAGGIAGYSGTALAGSGESYCRIEKSSWSGTVTATSGYPYAGGVVGYNYTGARVTRCFSEGAVTATGGNLPYAGGVAGYNSRVGKKTGTPATIDNCYSKAAVNATSASKVALGGGIAGANAAGAYISKCYATGAVTVTVMANGTDDIGGSTGVMVAANGGGIAGAQYVSDEGIDPAIASCAALNSAITATSIESGAAWNVCRIAGSGTDGNDTGVFTNNIALSSMSVTPARAAESWDKTTDGTDGEDRTAPLAQTMYADDLGWDFSGSGIWTMGSGGYPVFQ